MKKISALLLAAGMVAASAAPASAVDTKVDGQFLYSFGTASTGFNGDNMELAKQRLRMGLTMAASENLSGYVQFQILNSQFGTAQKNAGTAAEDVSVRQMYIDFVVPGTSAKVRMGRQLLGLPADAFGGNAVIDAGWGCHDGIVATTPVTSWLDVTALWARADYKDHATAGADLDRNISNDFYAAVASLKFDGVSASVYGAFATTDDFGYGATELPAVVGSYGLPGDAGQAYWVGATSTWTFFDPFTLKLSAAFGEFNSDANGEEGYNYHGWNIQAKASYAMDFGTPVLGAWYFSGSEDDKYGTMPSMTGYFTPTRTYHDAGFGLGGGQCYHLPTGNWGVQAGIEGMSFLKGLSHDFLVTYMEGTNDKDTASYDLSGERLTTEDSLVEFDFISTYKIYKNLTAALELSYIISDFDGSIGDREQNGKTVLDEDDWRVELSFEYKF